MAYSAEKEAATVCKNMNDYLADFEILVAHSTLLSPQDAVRLQRNLKTIFENVNSIHADGNLGEKYRLINKCLHDLYTVVVAYKEITRGALGRQLGRALPLIATSDINARNDKYTADIISMDMELIRGFGEDRVAMLNTAGLAAEISELVGGNATISQVQQLAQLYGNLTDEDIEEGARIRERLKPFEEAIKGEASRLVEITLRSIQRDHVRAIAKRDEASKMLDRLRPMNNTLDILTAFKDIINLTTFAKKLNRFEFLLSLESLREPPEAFPAGESRTAQAEARAAFETIQGRVGKLITGDTLIGTPAYEDSITPDLTIVRNNSLARALRAFFAINDRCESANKYLKPRSNPKANEKQMEVNAAIERCRAELRDAEGLVITLKDLNESSELLLSQIVELATRADLLVRSASTALLEASDKFKEANTLDVAQRAPVKTRWGVAEAEGGAAAAALEEGGGAGDAEGGWAAANPFGGAEALEEGGGAGAGAGDRRRITTTRPRDGDEAERGRPAALEEGGGGRAGAGGDEADGGGAAAAGAPSYAKRTRLGLGGSRNNRRTLSRLGKHRGKGTRRRVATTSALTRSRRTRRRK